MKVSRHVNVDNFKPRWFLRRKEAIIGIASFKSKDKSNLREDETIVINALTVVRRVISF